MKCATNSCSENPSELFVAHPKLHPRSWGAPGAPQNAEAAVVLAETLRENARGKVDPDIAHWKNTQISLYQHCLWENPKRPDFETPATSPAVLHEFSHLVVSIPFFYPVPLPALKKCPVSNLLHLICPNRCQLRSLIDEISSSMHCHATARRFLRCSVWCSVLGSFPGATSAPLASRNALLRTFPTTQRSGSAAPTSSSGLIGHMLRHKYHQSLFFCLKEALIYCVNANETLRQVLSEFHGWSSFCELVRSAMETARRSLVGPPEDALERFDKTLQHVSKQKIRRLFDCPGARDWERELTQECEKHFDESSAHIHSPHWGALRKAALRHTDAFVDLNWVRGLAFRPGDSAVICKKRALWLNALATELVSAREAFYFVGSKTKLRACLKKYSWDDVLVDVADLSEAFHRKRQCHFVTLDTETTVQQIRALRRVFNVPDGQTELPRLCGVCAVCECCQSFRSFLTPEKRRSSASNGLIAFGFSNALIDPSDPRTFFCARKNKYRPNKRKNAGARSIKTGRALRQAKHYGVDCKRTKLTQISLIGRALCFKNKIYAICSGCANFMTLSGRSFHNDSICCLRCVDSTTGKKLYTFQECDWCSKRCRSTHLTDVWCSDRKKHSLCRSCTIPAFSSASPFSVDWGQICTALSNGRKAHSK